jgi:hypothetical protein
VTELPTMSEYMAFTLHSPLKLKLNHESKFRCFIYWRVEQLLASCWRKSCSTRACTALDLMTLRVSLLSYKFGSSHKSLGARSTIKELSCLRKETVASCLPITCHHTTSTLLDNMPSGAWAALWSPISICGKLWVVASLESVSSTVNQESP